LDNASFTETSSTYSNGESYIGGAVYANGGSFTASQSNFTGFQAEYGGVVLAESGTQVTLTDSVFKVL